MMTFLTALRSMIWMRTFQTMPTSRIRSSTKLCEKRSDLSISWVSRSKSIRNASKLWQNIWNLCRWSLCTLSHLLMPRTKRLRPRSIWNRSPKGNLAVLRTKLKSWTTGLLTNKTDWTTSRTWSSRPTKRWTNSNLRWIGTRKSSSNGPLLPGRRRKITLLLRSIDGQMRPRSRSWPSRLKSSPLKSPANQMSWSGRLQKLKQPKLNLIRPLKNSNAFILRDINSICNGRRLSRTLEREMSS